MLTNNQQAQARGAKPAKRGESLTTQERRRTVSHEAWEAVFDILFEKHLIGHIPNDFYHEKVYFSKPEELEQKFDFLESQNLFAIKRCQEIVE